jgi:hypothetical protein
MKWFSRFSALMFGLLTLGVVKDLLERNRILVINDEDEHDEDCEESGPRDINSLRPHDYDNAMDLRGTPTHVCPCGSIVWDLKAIFKDGEIATYFLDMECANCGSLATAPTPIDINGMEE